MSMDFLTINTLGIVSNAGEITESLTGYLKKIRGIRAEHGVPRRRPST